MAILKSFSKQLQQLRWKLTLSYAGVTISVLLVLVLIGGFVSLSGLIGGLNNGFWQGRIIEAASIEYGPALRLHLSQTPPDRTGIAEWIQRFENATTYLPIADTIPLFFNAGTLDIWVYNFDGRLLAATPPHLAENGQAYAEQTSSTMQQIVEVALSGETDTQQLFQLDSSSQQVMFAIPIWDEEHEQVLGVLVMSGILPTTTELLTEVLRNLAIALTLISILSGILGTIFGFWAGRSLVHRLNRLSEASLAWSKGDFETLVDDVSADELGQLARRLNQMAQELQHLLDTRRELVVVEERNRIARDLHDSAKQQAFAAAAQISAVRRLIQNDPQTAVKHIEEAERLIYDLRQELSSLIQELRPAALEDKGLASALRDYTKNWSRHNTIDLELRVQREQSLALRIEQSVFRVIQETLANVARHSQATHVEVILSYSKDYLRCEVKDDGIGFNSEQVTDGFGLRSMQERIKTLGGILQIESSKGTGTKISFEIPLEFKEQMENV